MSALTDERLPYRIKAAALLAAALDVCEVREDWGHRMARDDGTTYDLMHYAREKAEWLASLDPTPIVLRRLRITTPTEEVS